MKMTTVTKVNKDSDAERKGKNDAAFLIRSMLCPLLVITHQINKNTIKEMIFMRNGLHDWAKKV